MKKIKYFIKLYKKIEMSLKNDQSFRDMIVEKEKNKLNYLKNLKNKEKQL